MYEHISLTVKNRYPNTGRYVKELYAIRCTAINTTATNTTRSATKVYILLLSHQHCTLLLKAFILKSVTGKHCCLSWLN